MSSACSFTLRLLRAGVHGCPEALPLVEEGIERVPPIVGQLVVATRWTLTRLSPGRFDESGLTKAAEKRVDRALACDQAIRLRQHPCDFEAVALSFTKKGEDAVLDGSPTHLGKPVTFGARNHVRAY